jgi:hypothetical protein
MEFVSSTPRMEVDDIFGNDKLVAAEKFNTAEGNELSRPLTTPKKSSRLIRNQLVCVRCKARVSYY